MALWPSSTSLVIIWVVFDKSLAQWLSGGLPMSLIHMVDGRLSWVKAILSSALVDTLLSDPVGWT
jgi:hypothetical protein